MTTTEYKKKIEDELVKNFLNEFYEKVGYYPTVIINRQVKTKGSKLLTLSELETYFEPYLPTIFGKKMKLTAKSRSRPLPELRFIFFFIARTLRYGLLEIGQHVGKRDHTTVIHGLTTFKNLYETDDGFRNRYYDIINAIKKDYESSTLDYLDKTQDQPQPNLFFGLLQGENPTFE